MHKIFIKIYKAISDLMILDN